MNLNLSPQEIEITNYLQSRNGSEVSIYELIRFAKDPKNVKPKTLQKYVSEIRRKYVDAGLTVPFVDVSFKILTKVHYSNVPIQTPLEQRVVHIKKKAVAQVVAPVILPPKKDEIRIDKMLKRVHDINGWHQLNDSEWYAMKYFFENQGRLIPITELRDKVYYEKAGSQTPARWFESIGRSVNFLKRQVPGLKDKLLVTRTTDTCYMLKLD